MIHLLATTPPPHVPPRHDHPALPVITPSGQYKTVVNSTLLVHDGTASTGVLPLKVDLLGEEDALRGASGARSPEFKQRRHGGLYNDACRGCLCGKSCRGGTEVSVRSLVMGKKKIS